MTEAKDYLDFLEQHRLMDDAQKYPLAVEYARSCEREIATLREERDRLREILERLRTRMAEPQQPIIQWDAGTWIERIDAALEGRE